jgi:pimeloyl-ACP methyl ester carboxylesterase
MPRCSRLARLLLLLGALQAAAAIGWFAWRAPHSGLQAVLGAVVVLLAGPIVLAVELVLLVIVDSGTATAPRPDLRQLFGAWLRETRFFYQVFYWRQPLRWRAQPDFLDPSSRGRRGVVFVHGYMCNRGFWTPWMRELRHLGHPHLAINLEPVFAPLDEHAAAIEDAVTRMHTVTGQPVTIVAHSMGGLAVRAWLRATPDPGRVLRVVTIGSPHHGTWLARFSGKPNGRQMRQNSAWLRRLADDERARSRPPWTCWYGTCDNVVFPVASATLPDADNHALPGLPHVALAFSPTVFRHTVLVLTSPVQTLSK